MPFFQPKSVLQLVILGFLLAIAPLCLAILYTIQTLGELSEKNRVVSAQVIAMTRHGQDLQRDLLDLERRTHQYLTLKNTELLALFQRERQAILDRLHSLQQLIGEDQNIIADLQSQISTLAPLDTEQIITQFKSIVNLSTALGDWLQTDVDRRVSAHAAEADSIKDSLLVMVFVMALATLMLMLLSSYWINRPIQRILSEIKSLGGGDLSRRIDISGPQEVKVLGQELEWLRGRLHEIDQQKLQFLRHISHELKTPLANLREGTDLLAEQVTGTLSTRQQEIVTIVQQNGIELQRLIENLLDYNQLPLQSLTPELIQLQALGQQLLGNYEIRIESKELTVSCDWQAVTWFADREKLKICLDNLISNAVNYTPHRGCIEISCTEQNNCLVIEVANSGTAIPAEEIPHLFEPFYQGSSIRHGPIKGSGIGLSLALECMQAQGGRLALVKHPRLAVCFRLICPSLNH